MQKRQRIYSIVFIGVLVGAVFANMSFTHFIEREARANALQPTSFAGYLGTVHTGEKLIKNLWLQGRCGYIFAGLTNSQEASQLPVILITFQKKRPPELKIHTLGLLPQDFPSSLITFFSIEEGRSVQSNFVALDSVTPRAP